METYNEEYFERGIQVGRSMYQNYRWIPDLTLPLAMSIIDYLGIKPDATILDFGCAKGYLVKAFRLLNRNAYGVDISEYALFNSDPSIRVYCRNVTSDIWHNISYNYFIAKDVFEHLEEEELKKILKKVAANIFFAIIPLGNEFGYTCPANDLDSTHKICKNSDWWKQFFCDQGFKIISFDYHVPGIKEAYYDKYPEAHGFFTFQRK